MVSIYLKGIVVVLELKLRRYGPYYDSPHPARRTVGDLHSYSTRRYSCSTEKRPSSFRTETIWEAAGLGACWHPLLPGHARKTELGCSRVCVCGWGKLCVEKAWSRRAGRGSCKQRSDLLDLYTALLSRSDLGHSTFRWVLILILWLVGGWGVKEIVSTVAHEHSNDNFIVPNDESHPRSVTVGG